MGGHNAVRSVFAALVGAALLSISAVARGQNVSDPTALEPVRVSSNRNVGVVLPACADPGPFDGPGVVRQLRTELVEDAIERVDAVLAGDDTPMLARISFDVASCADALPTITVIIDDLVTRKNVRRSIDLSDVRGAIRTRAMALAIAELLRASFTELALADAPPSAVEVPAAVREALRTRLRARVAEPRPQAPAPQPPPRPAPIAPAGSSHRVALAVDARTASIGPLLTGARLLYELTAARWGRASLALRVDAGASTGAAFDPLGTVQLTSANAAIGALYEVSPLPGFLLGVGARVEGGAVWIAPTAMSVMVRSFDSVAPSLAIHALAVARAELDPRVWLGLELELGATPVGPIVQAREGATDRVIGSVAGASGGARIAVGLRF